MKRVALLGASSMLGREVERQLRAAGADVIRCGRGPDMDIVVDLGSGIPPSFSDKRDAEVLIHCAAAFGGEDFDGVRLNLAVNAGGAVDALEIAARLNVGRIVYAGSLSSDPALEPDRSMTAYGMSKLECERILRWGCAREGRSFCSLRLTQLWDTEGACCQHQPWFGRIVAYASQGLVLRMPRAEGPRNFLHVSDAARLLIAAANSSITGCYPVTYPRDIDLHALALEACAVFGQGGQVLVDPNKTPFRKIAFPQDFDAFDTLGLRPEIGIVEGLRLIRDAGTAANFGPVDVK